MPRKPRIERSDGIFHVINRGNYRRGIFEQAGAKASFEQTLFEACERFSWRLMSYSILSNHFHLSLKTPQGNLSEGMRWLQGSYAAKFNRYRKEQGHLFQGRFKSLVVEPGMHLVNLVDYIHLNALRAGLEQAEGLGKYRWSSLYYFPKRKRRPEYLDCTWLNYLEGMEDSHGGWRRYIHHLRMRVAETPEEVAKLEQEMNRGWCIGSVEFKEALADELMEEEGVLDMEGTALAEFNRLQWEALFKKCLEKLGKSKQAIREEQKSAPWKLAIAMKLKRKSSVPNAWLSEHLNMGTPKSVSALCGKYQREAEKSCPFAKKLKDLKIEH